MQVTEADLKFAVSEYLKYGTNQGRWYADRLNSGVVYVKRGDRTYAVQLCQEGTADFMVLMSYRGECPECQEYERSILRVIFLELKSEKGKTSPAQNDFKTLVEAQGAEYHLIRSIEELEEILE